MMNGIQCSAQLFGKHKIKKSLTESSSTMQTQPSTEKLLCCQRASAQQHYRPHCCYCFYRKKNENEDVFYHRFFYHQHSTKGVSKLMLKGAQLPCRECITAQAREAVEMDYTDFMKKKEHDIRY